MNTATVGDTIKICYSYKDEVYYTSAEIWDEIDPTYMYSEDFTVVNRGSGYKIRFVDCEGNTRYYTRWESFYKDDIVNDIGKLHIIQKQKDDTCLEIGRFRIQKLTEDRCILEVNDKSVLYYKDTPFSTKSWHNNYRHWDDCHIFNGYLSKLTKKQRSFVNEMLDNKEQIANSKAFKDEFKKIIMINRFTQEKYSSRNYDTLIDPIPVGVEVNYPILRKTSHIVNENNDYTDIQYVISGFNGEFVIEKTKEHYNKVY